MKVRKRSTGFGVEIVLILNQGEMNTLRRAEQIADKMRELAEPYENGGEGTYLDDDLARAEHGPGEIADQGPEFVLEYKSVDMSAIFVRDLASR